MLPRSSHHRRGHSSTYRSGSSSSEDYEVVSIEADSPALMDITTSPNDAGFSPYNVVERSTSLAPASPVQTTETETQFIEHHPPVAALDSPTHPAAPVRRPRGRPRKHPIEKPKREAKEGRANNGRSKTGCQTCRKRKKKCDETKPTCLNCTKNNLTCGGYPPATHWQPGRQNESKSNVLPPLLPYLSDDLDNFLFDHFHQVLDNMQEVPIAANTHSIRDHIFPLAPNDPGLMSAILAMSGYKWLQACPTPEENRYSLSEVEVRACQHFEKTLKRLMAPRPDGVWSEAEMASSIMLCLIATIDSHVARIYAFALVQLPRMLGNPRNSFSANLRRFASNFFTSHYSSFSITCTSKSRQELFPEEFSLPELIGTPEAGVYFGVLDELFLFLHKVKVLRDDVRARRSVNPSMMLDYPMVIRARALEKELQEWRCHQPNGSYQNASMLWRDCIWIYLKRTISTVPQLRELEGSVDNALAKLIAMRNEPSEQGTLIMPLFLLGCTALTNKQRSAVTVSFQVLIDQRRTDNLKTARDVVKYMWQLLDAGSDDAWDWEVLIEQLGKQGVSLS